MENILSALPHEIEEHVAATNRFFQLSRLTLDDLHEYAFPMSAVARATNAASEGLISELEAFAVMRDSIAQLRQIHVEMNSAEDAAQKRSTTN